MAVIVVTLAQEELNIQEVMTNMVMVLQEHLVMEEMVFGMAAAAVVVFMVVVVEATAVAVAVAAIPIHLQ